MVENVRNKSWKAVVKKYVMMMMMSMMICKNKQKQRGKGAATFHPHRTVLLGLVFTYGYFIARVVSVPSDCTFK